MFFCSTLILKKKKDYISSQWGRNMKLCSKSFLSIMLTTKLIWINLLLFFLKRLLSCPECFNWSSTCSNTCHHWLLEAPGWRCKHSLLLNVQLICCLCVYVCSPSLLSLLILWDFLFQCNFLLKMKFISLNYRWIQQLE